MMQRTDEPESPIYDITLQADAPFAQAAKRACLVEAAEETLRWAGLSRAELTIVITDDESQRVLNRDYRGVDVPTDVLSFAAREEDEGAPSPANLPADLAAALDAYLGDIVIAYPYAERQAARYQNHPAAELRMLTVHGVLHLLGHDHTTTNEATTMWQAQRAILNRWDDPDTSQRIYDDGPT